MSDTWTPEFEKMWRIRLVEITDEKQPFRDFIEMIAEMDALNALKMALVEIDRLRLQISKNETTPTCDSGIIL
jgi:hypothetical protein